MSPRSHHTFRPLVWPLVLLPLSLALLPPLPSPADEPATDQPATEATTPPLNAEQQTLLERIQSVHNEANQLYQQSEFARALPLLEQLLSLHQQLLPTNQFPQGHPQLITCYRQLCHVAGKARDYPALLRWSLEGLAIARQLYPPTQFPHGHVNLAAILHSVGTGYYNVGNYKNARTYMSEAMDMTTEIPDISDNDRFSMVISTQLTIADSYVIEGSYIAAVESLSEAIYAHRSNFDKDRFPDGHPLLAEMLFTQARAHRLAGNARGALDNSQEAYAMYCGLRTNGDPGVSELDVFFTIVELALAYRDIGDIELARSFLDEAIAEMKRIDPESNKYTVERLQVVMHLMSLAYLNGRLADANALRTHLEQETLKLSTAECDFAVSYNLAGQYLSLGLMVQRQGDFDSSKLFFAEGIDLLRRLFPTASNTNGHPAIVQANTYLGNLYQDMGRYEDAFEKYSEALSMARRLFSRETYPHGHVVLSGALHGMATHCWLIGETEAAIVLYRQVLADTEARYPPETYPQGHRDLQLIYSEWAHVLIREQRIDEAQEYLEKALAIAAARFPESAFPHGHDELATLWEDLGRIARLEGDTQEALRQFGRALASYRNRDQEHSPRGSLGVALMEAELGRTHWAAGDAQRAEDFFQRSLELRQNLFPQDAFPAGHPMVANILRDLGLVCRELGKTDQAHAWLQEAVRTEQSLAESFFGGGSEAQLLNLAARRLRSVDHLLTVWSESARPAEDVYGWVWMRRGFVPKLIRHRQLALRELAATNRVEDYERYVDIRRELSRALLVSVTNDAGQTEARLRKIQELNSQKEELERSMSNSLDDWSASDDHPAQLAEVLPADTVFVDYARYHRQAAGAADASFVPGHGTDRYTAFIIAPGSPITGVDVGDAATVDDLVRRWRQAVIDDRASDAANQLRSLIWDPVKALFPATTHTVYVAPDGALAHVAWGAFPRDDGTGVLLEQFAFATVPHGTFLLEQLQTPPKAVTPSDTFLTIGDIDYGDHRIADEDASLGLKRLLWEPLKAGCRELQAIRSTVDQPRVLLLTGRDASVERVLEHLPHARWAHFATHGFFVDDHMDLILRLAGSMRDPERPAVNRARSTVLTRSPWVRSGLVLADANVVGPRDELGIPQTAQGLLTAETIAAFDMSDLEMVVLSACDTSRGDVASGDGVLGIQAAFHIAGARNVIASLWKVDDDATAELMQEFYRLLGREQLTPLAALRQAQLALMRQPNRFDSAVRGPDLSVTLPLVAGKPATTQQQAPTRNWAAFLLSGPGF